MLTELKRKTAKYVPGFLLDRLVRFRAWLRVPQVRAGTTEEVFTDIKRRNFWGNAESRSGGGSTIEITAPLRNWLPQLFAKLEVKTLVDIPCGDFAWMQHVPMGNTRYIGGDIVNELVEANRASYGNPTRDFLHVDLVRDPLPAGDLLLCKDCLIHLAHDLGLAALRNMYRAGYRYVLTTTYPEQSRNVNILTGDTWRLNLLLPPFGLPAPLEQICEGPDAGMNKYIALWPRESLRHLCQ